MILRKNSTGESVLRMQQWLNFLGASSEALPETGEFDTTTRDGLMAFQEAAGLKPDGIFGKMSYAALRKAVHSRYTVLGGLELSQAYKLFGKVVMPADQYEKGYNSFRLRTDAAYWYKLMYNELKAAGALVTSSGSDRSLNAQVSAARSTTSMHYIATAFDLYIYSAMIKPETDPYVVEKNGDRWRVWARCTDGKGEMRTIANPVTYRQRKGTGVPVKDWFVDLTAIAARYGYIAIKPRSSFFTGGSEMGAEWWHFQNEYVLFPLYSTFGEELQTLHAPAAIQKSPLRQYVERVFKQNWF
jgi:peptidoglycan hydrolase-like protein with peptidoglycan-binding domain